MKLTVKRIIFALMLSMSTLALSMYNDKDDCHTRLMDLLDTYYPEVHSGTTSPIPAAAMPNFSYTPDLLPQLSPIRTTTWLPDQASYDLEDFDINEFLDTDAKALSVEMALRDDADKSSSLENFIPTEQVPFIEKLSAESHIPSMSKKFECPKCLYLTRDHHDFKNHILYKHEGIRFFFCPDPECAEAFKSNSLMREHTKKVHPELPISFLSQETKDSTKKGVATFKELLPAKNKSTTLKKKNPSEVNSSLNEQRNCPVPHCLYTTNEHRQLKYHIISQHTALRPFVCPHAECNKEFNQKPALHKHIKEKHPGLATPALSQKIKDSIEKALEPFFRSDFDCNAHPTIQKSEPQEFECPVPECKYYAQEYSQLKNHILCTHTSMHPFICPDTKCQKSFNANHARRKHVQENHPGMKIPPISQTEQDSMQKAIAPFLQSISLAKRKLGALSKIKPSEDLSGVVDQNDLEDSFELLDETHFKTLLLESATTDVTSAVSSLPSALTPIGLKSPEKEKVSDEPSIRHLFKGHQGSLEKRRAPTKQNFDCPVLECKYSTSEMPSLKSHILCQHTKIRPFVCPNPQCKKEFSSNSNLQTHAKKYHPDLQIPPPSQEAKDSITKALAPFLQTFSRTKEQADTLSNKGN